MRDVASARPRAYRRGMKRARTATAIIWSTVVSAGAMLGCSHSPPTNQPTAAVAEPAVAVEVAPPQGSPATVGESRPVQDQPTPSPAAAAPIIAEVARVNITVASTPPGASVYRNGTLIGTTPVNVSAEPSDTPLALRLELDGYTTKDATVTPSADTRVSFALAKIAAAPRARGTSGKRTGRGFVLS